MNVTAVVNCLLHGIKLLTVDVESLIYWHGRKMSEEGALYPWHYWPGGKEIVDHFANKLKIPVHLLVNNVLNDQEEIDFLKKNPNFEFAHLTIPDANTLIQVKHYEKTLKKSELTHLKPNQIMHIGQYKDYNHGALTKAGYMSIAIEDYDEKKLRRYDSDLKKYRVYKSIEDFYNFITGKIKEKIKKESNGKKDKNGKKKKNSKHADPKHKS